MDCRKETFREIQAVLIDLIQILSQILMGNLIPEIPDFDEIRCRGNDSQLLAQVHAIHECVGIFPSLQDQGLENFLGKDIRNPREFGS